MVPDVKEVQRGVARGSKEVWRGIEALEQFQRHRQAQPWRVQQVSAMFIIIWNGTCLYTIFQSQHYLDWFQGDQATLGYPQRSLQTLLWHVQQGPVYSSKIHMVHVYLYFSKTNWFKIVPGWSRQIWCQEPFFLEKYVPCQILMNITGTCCTHYIWLNNVANIIQRLITLKPWKYINMYHVKFWT